MTTLQESDQKLVWRSDEYIKGKLGPNKSARFEHLFRTNPEFRRKVIGDLAAAHVRTELSREEDRMILDPDERRGIIRAITRNRYQVELAFSRTTPNEKQIRLREVVWAGSRFSKVFPSVDMETFAMPGDPPTPAPTVISMQQWREAHARAG